jgi:hypothetical protein
MTEVDLVFRRFEAILPAGVDDDGETYPPVKLGLMAVGSDEVLEAWIDQLRGPTRSSLPPNCRFYFTERGWREVGRKVAAAARRTGQDYRIIAIKETDAQVVWRDKDRDYEVAVQPRSKRPWRRRAVSSPSDIAER